ncbi:LysE family translocator [Winogradskyella haliclonae]|uniref:LysE family translocator n=1 Tax=Winogradskyella haliclonae TaxID=2048558 RepID=A0ABQ2BZI1_9FLAO|nr:LysE family translocator [Winogradskyella haliclonae]GGI57232.1 LysE family translocator [Winogradskyella haliclonae]
MSATAALAISPGPDNIYVLVQSLTNSKTHALATVAGLMIGCIIHTTLLAFGVSAVIRDNDNIFLGIKILGAVYLLYLAYKVYKSDSKIYIDTENAPQKSLKQLFIQGFFMNVLNPKVTIFFLAFFPTFLFSETLSPVLQFYVLGGLFIVVSFIIFSSIALLANTIKRSLLKNKNSGLMFKWLQIIVFIGIAVFIVL